MVADADDFVGQNVSRQFSRIIPPSHVHSCAIGWERKGQYEYVPAANERMNKLTTPGFWEAKSNGCTLAGQVT